MATIDESAIKCPWPEEQSSEWARCSAGLVFSIPQIGQDLVVIPINGDPHPVYLGKVVKVELSFPSRRLFWVRTNLMPRVGRGIGVYLDKALTKPNVWGDTES